MKKFLPTYLYVKTHNITGLKYFGKTTGSDPYKYLGSGEYWLNHLKIHGKDISTEIVGFFEDKEKCISTALQFSEDNNIVGAINENGKKIWANQVVENGLDGGYTGRTNYGPHSDEAKQKISLSKKGQIPWNIGKKGVTPGNTTPRSEKTKQLLREANLGKKQSQETINKRAKKLKGHIVTKETRKKISDKQKGKTLSPDHIQKLKNRIVSDDTKQKIRDARKLQIITQETKDKLKGKIVCVNKEGLLSRVSKDLYYSQSGPKENWEWVAHRSKEARMRRG